MVTPVCFLYMLNRITGSVKRFLIFILVIVSMLSMKNRNEVQDMKNSIRIVLNVGEQTFQATLYNNATSRSLVQQMPFTVDVEDYASTEKIFYPKPALSIEDAPAGMDPSVGDITYYAPWGDVVIFYKDFSYAKGLIPMGKMDDVSAFVKALSSNEKVTFKKL